MNVICRSCLRVGRTAKRSVDIAFIIHPRVARFDYDSASCTSAIPLFSSEKCSIEADGPLKEAPKASLISVSLLTIRAY